MKRLLLVLVIGCGDEGGESDAEVCDLATPSSCGFLGDPNCIDI